MFLVNLNLVLAHTLVYEHKVEGIFLFATGPDPAPLNTQESMGDMMAGMTQQLPALTQVTNAQLIPTAQAQLAANQATSAGQNALATQLYGEFGPQNAAIGNQINAQNAQAQAASDLNVAGGTGKSLVQQTLANQEMVDPGATAARESVANQYNSLVNSLDPNKLSSSEAENAQRSINQSNLRTGNQNNPSQLATVQNAMTFGDALTQKRNQLSSILSAGSSILPSIKSGIDAFQVATGRPSMPNPGQNQQVGALTNAGDNANSMSSQLLGIGGNLAQNAQTLNSQRRSAMDNAISQVGGIANDVGAVAGGLAGVMSDKNIKNNIVDYSINLDELDKLPIYRWEYNDAPGVVHVGPMAQDFKALFNLGDSDKVIQVVDALGVLFALVKELREENRVLSERISKIF